MFFKTFSLVLFMIQIKADNVVSDTNERKGDNGEFKMGFDNSERRFFQSFKDEDWHIVHLKESDFMEREECEETFEDKVKRYKESLKNDGSRVRFVSADAIPRDDSFTRTCKPKQKDKVIKEGNSKQTNIDENNKTNDNVIRRAKESRNGTSERNKDTATSAKAEKGAKKKNARRKDTDYIFSEAEYDEYGDQWDLGECAADVEQIDLELEDIHEYDVECQFMLEWRSMD